MFWWERVGVRAEVPHVGLPEGRPFQKGLSGNSSGGAVPLRRGINRGPRAARASGRQTLEVLGRQPHRVQVSPQKPWLLGRRARAQLMPCIPASPLLEGPSQSHLPGSRRPSPPGTAPPHPPHPSSLHPSPPRCHRPPLCAGDGRPGRVSQHPVTTRDSARGC